MRALYQYAPRLSTGSGDPIELVDDVAAAEARPRGCRESLSSVAVLGGQDPEWLTVGDILERLVFLYDFGVIRPGRSAINDVVNVDTGEVVTDPVLAQTVKDMIDPLRDSFGKTGRGRSHHR